MLSSIEWYIILALKSKIMYKMFRTFFNSLCVDKYTNPGREDKMLFNQFAFKAYPRFNYDLCG